MHYTLHLTDACNMACGYCYVAQGVHNMPFSVAKATVDMAAQGGQQHFGLAFFGGEPLLCKDLIEETVDYAAYIAKKRGIRIYFKTTTNGLLLDEAFLRYSLEHEMFIALSHDGVREAHDHHRLTRDGSGTFAALEEKAKALLAYHPFAPVMMTVSPETVQHYAKGVQYLFDLGFRYLICSMNYAGNWDERSLNELQQQYKQLARIYERWTLAEEKFYFSPFEVKLASHIQGGAHCAERCELGKKQISVAPDGRLYPCVQFVGDERYSIGDVQSGIDQKRQQALYLANDREKDSCVGCAIKGRCNHYCGCLNRQATGSIDLVAPSLCAHERIVLPIADALAARLYKRRSAMFIQKQYNDMYPLLSLTEERT